jgi:hypothetical protein
MRCLNAVADVLPGVVGALPISQQRQTDVLCQLLLHVPLYLLLLLEMLQDVATASTVH